jgi:hypothetical protein
MRKIAITAAIAATMLLLQNCGSSKKAATAAKATTSYAKDIVPMMKASCMPCHFPPDGRKEPLDSYDAVKKHIGEVIERVKLPQSDAKFMPYKLKKPALTEAEINMLVKWKEENMPE